jgi:hypothetical protein
MTPWQTDKLFDRTKLRKSRINELGFPPTPPYILECFLSVQDGINRAFIDDASVPIIKMNAFPYPAYEEIEFGEYVSTLFPFLFVVCMIFSLKSVIKVK